MTVSTPLDPAALRVTLGTYALEPNRAGQWITLEVENLFPASVQVAGLNLSVQIGTGGSAVGSGPGSAPRILSVDLVTGSPFASNSTATHFDGGLPQAGQWSVTTLTDTVSLPAAARSLLARVEIDTVGLDAGRWPLSLSITFPSSDLTALTSYVQLDGMEIPIEIWGIGTIEVPEPRFTSLVGGGLAVVWVLLRHRRFQRSRSPRLQPRRPGVAPHHTCRIFVATEKRPDSASRST